MIEISPFFSGVIAIAVVMCGGLVSWGVTKATIKFNWEQIKQLKSDLAELKKDLNEINKQIRQSLYSPDGLTIFTPRKLCGEMRDDCEKRFCIKIDEVIDDNKITHKEIMDRIEKNRVEVSVQMEKNREIVSSQYADIREFMGQVKKDMDERNKR